MEIRVQHDDSETQKIHRIFIFEWAELVITGIVLEKAL
jgi:hypothetical protein